MTELEELWDIVKDVGFATCNCGGQIAVVQSGKTINLYCRNCRNIKRILD